MFPFIATALLAIAGVAIILCAKPLSDFEKRLKERKPCTKITGWSGTQRGVWSWRLVGLLVILLSAFVAVELSR
jgi:hypothetical protein